MVKLKAKMTKSSNWKGAPAPIKNANKVKRSPDQLRFPYSVMSTLFACYRSQHEGSKSRKKLVNTATSKKAATKSKHNTSKRISHKRRPVQKDKTTRSNAKKQSKSCKHKKSEAVINRKLLIHPQRNSNDKLRSESSNVFAVASKSAFRFIFEKFFPSKPSVKSSRSVQKLTKKPAAYRSRTSQKSVSGTCIKKSKEEREYENWIKSAPPNISKNVTLEHYLRIKKAVRELQKQPQGERNDSILGEMLREFNKKAKVVMTATESSTDTTDSSESDNCGSDSIDKNNSTDKANRQGKKRSPTKSSDHSRNSSRRKLARFKRSSNSDSQVSFITKNIQCDPRDIFNSQEQDYTLDDIRQFCTKFLERLNAHMPSSDSLPLDNHLHSNSIIKSTDDQSK